MLSCSVLSSLTCLRAKVELGKWGQMGQAERASVIPLDCTAQHILGRILLTPLSEPCIYVFVLLWICICNWNLIQVIVDHCNRWFVCTWNCWDHHWCWRYTSHHNLAENLITHNIEDGRKYSTLCFMCLVQVLEKKLPPVFAEAEISSSPSLH